MCCRIGSRIHVTVLQLRSISDHQRKFCSYPTDYGDQTHLNWALHCYLGAMMMAVRVSIIHDQSIMSNGGLELVDHRAVPCQRIWWQLVPGNPLKTEVIVHLRLITAF